MILGVYNVLHILLWKRKKLIVTTEIKLHINYVYLYSINNYFF